MGCFNYNQRLRAHKISEAERAGRNLIASYFASLHLRLIKVEKKLKENYSASYDVDIDGDLLDAEGGRS